MFLHIFAVRTYFSGELMAASQFAPFIHNRLYKMKEQESRPRYEMVSCRLTNCCTGTGRFLGERLVKTRRFLPLLRMVILTKPFSGRSFT